MTPAATGLAVEVGRGVGPHDRAEASAEAEAVVGAKAEHAAGRRAQEATVRVLGPTALVRDTSLEAPRGLVLAHAHRHIEAYRQTEWTPAIDALEWDIYSKNMGVSRLFLEVNVMLLPPNVEGLGQCLPPLLDEGEIAEFLESLGSHEPAIPPQAIPDNVFSASRSGAHSVGPSLQTIPECQLVIVLAHDLSAGGFNGLDGALTRSGGNDVDWRLQLGCVITEDLDSVVGIVNAPTGQQLAGSDGVLWRRGQTSLVYPVLYPLEVDNSPGLLVLVDEATLGEELGDWGLTTLEASPQTGTGTRFLTLVSSTRGSAVARALTSTDTFLVVGRPASGCEVGQTDPYARRH